MFRQTYHGWKRLIGTVIAPPLIYGGAYWVAWLSPWTGWPQVPSSRFEQYFVGPGLVTVVAGVAVLCAGFVVIILLAALGAVLYAVLKTVTKWSNWIRDGFEYDRQVRSDNDERRERAAAKAGQLSEPEGEPGRLSMATKVDSEKAPR